MAAEYSVKTIIGSAVAVSVEDGEKLGAFLRQKLEAGEDLVLSFADTTHISTAFLHTGIGALHKEFPSSTITKRLNIVSIGSRSHALLKNVIDRVKIFHDVDGSTVHDDSEVITDDTK